MHILISHIFEKRFLDFKFKLLKFPLFGFLKSSRSLLFLLSNIKLFNTCTYVREASFDLIYLIFVNYLSYTPISDPEAKGYFDLLIKV